MMSIKTCHVSGIPPVQSDNTEYDEDIDKHNKTHLLLLYS